MKKWKIRSALIALAVLLAGCSSNAQYNSSASGNVGTAWGGDVHSTVQGVSAERASCCWPVVPVMRSIIAVHRVMSAPPGVGMCTQRFRAYLLNEPGAIRQR